MYSKVSGGCVCTCLRRLGRVQVSYLSKTPRETGENDVEALNVVCTWHFETQIIF